MDYIAKCRRLDQELCIDQVFDISKREFKILNKQACLYFMPFLVNSSEIINVFLGFYVSNKEFSLSNRIAHQNLTISSDLDKISLSVLEGVAVIVVEDDEECYMIDVRSYPSRGISEPETEKVVRGSKEGFTENMAINLSLVRRRIKSAKLRTILYQVGELSKTNVVLIYLEDYVDKKALNSVQKALRDVKITELTISLNWGIKLK